MDVSGLNVYLSGPMTGQADWNVHAFNLAEECLLDSDAAWVFNPARSALRDNERGHAHYMTKDLHELTYHHDGNAFFHGIAMLPGWEDSEGARLEREVAIACGMEVIYL